MLRETVLYNDAPADVEQAFRRSEVVADFLPDPTTLADMSRKEKVTISLDKSTLIFFRQEAERHGVHYQTMINNLLGSYAATHATR